MIGGIPELATELRRPGDARVVAMIKDLGGSAAYWVVLVCTDYVEKAETGGVR